MRMDADPNDLQPASKDTVDERDVASEAPHWARQLDENAPIPSGEGSEVFVGADREDRVGARRRSECRSEDDGARRSERWDVRH